MSKNTEKFKKGTLEMLILKIISVEDCYVYEIMQTINSISKNVLNITTGCMYPALYNLEEEGLIESYKKTAGKRMERVYYHITEKGEKSLKEMKQDYYDVVFATDAVLKYEKNATESEEQCN